MLEKPFGTQVSCHLSFPRCSWDQSVPALLGCFCHVDFSIVLALLPQELSHREEENVVEVTAGSCDGSGGGIMLSRLSGDSGAHLAPGSPSSRTLPPAAAAWSAARGLEVTATLSPYLFLTPPPHHLTTQYAVQTLTRSYRSSFMSQIEVRLADFVVFDEKPSGVMSYCTAIRLLFCGQWVGLYEWGFLLCHG